MEHQEAIEIAEQYLSQEELSTEGYVAQVVTSAIRETEVVFSMRPPCDHEDCVKEHRVFLDAYGDFLGLLFADGTTSAPLRRSPRPAELTKSSDDESSIASATRYLKAHDVDTEKLDPKVLETARLVHVWYEIETDEDVFGGGPEVYMTDLGTIIRAYSPTA